VHSTYHNHTRWSDGQASVARVVAQAHAHGVAELGISDHLVLRPSGEVPPWSMRADQLSAYVADLLGYRDVRDPVVRLGLEVDWFPGHADAIADALAPYPFDYLIGSVHEVDGFVVDARAELWDAMADGERDRAHRDYWRNVQSMAESRLFDIVGHLDLTKKFGHRPTIDLQRPIEAALDAIAAADMAVELNTAGWYLPCQEAYPSAALLKQCHRRDIPVTIAADAHRPEHLVRGFQRATVTLQTLGFRSVACYAGRKRRQVRIVTNRRSSTPQSRPRS